MNARAGTEGCTAARSSVDAIMDRTPPRKSTCGCVRVCTCVGREGRRCCSGAKPHFLVSTPTQHQNHQNPSFISSQNFPASFTLSRIYLCYTTCTHVHVHAAGSNQDSFDVVNPCHGVDVGGCVWGWMVPWVVAKVLWTRLSENHTELLKLTSKGGTRTSCCLEQL